MNSAKFFLWTETKNVVDKGQKQVANTAIWPQSV